MSTLVVAQHEGGVVHDATSRIVSAAGILPSPLDILVAGENCSAVASWVATLEGVDRVLLCESPIYGHHLAEPLCALIVSLAHDYGHIIFPATAFGKDIAPRVAACLDVMVVSDVVACFSASEFARPIYAGAALERVCSTDDRRVISLRPSAFSPCGFQAPAPVELLPPGDDPGLTLWLGDDLQDRGRPGLSSASIVVSGGQGLGSAEGFGLIEELADLLGAAVGASRAAVDLGYASNDLQVGQTGVSVAPDLYFAIGVSGALQHIAGISGARVIVAINKDADAPIFKLADYGLVADLFEALPALITLLGGGGGHRGGHRERSPGDDDGA